MSRLVVVSNRVADAAQDRAPAAWPSALHGGAARTGGLWFGWSGKIASRHRRPMHIEQAGATSSYATIDLTATDHDGLLQRLRQRHAVAAAPLSGWTWSTYEREHIAGYGAVNQLFADKLVPLLRARRHHLGARLPPDPAGRRAARARRAATASASSCTCRCRRRDLLAALPGARELIGRCRRTTWSASRPRATSSASQDYVRLTEAARVIAHGRAGCARRPHVPRRRVPDQHRHRGDRRGRPQPP